MRDTDLTLRNYYLSRAVNKLAYLFGLSTTTDLAGTIALRELQGLPNAIPSNTLKADKLTTTLIDTIINTSEGALPVRQITDSSGNASATVISVLNSFLSGNRTTETGNSTDQLRQKFSSLFNIHYSSPTGNTTGNYAFNDMKEILGAAGDDGLGSLENISVVKVNFPSVAPNIKNVDAISLFMNAIPTIELSRAVPYVELKFLSTRDSIDNTGRVNALSLLKFLEGAVEVSNQDNVRQALIAANRIPGNVGISRTGTDGKLSQVGMEIFTSPQTLVNMSQGFNPDERVVPIQDPTRPFLTLKGITIDVQPSIGFFSFKTGKIDFVLHDKSRLADLADFIRPDLYSNTECILEYGWSHPDGPEANNPFADLLNFSRTREKYMIRNINFSFADNGEVNLNLDIAAKGATDLSTETISSSGANSKIGNTLRRIQQLSDLVKQYKDKLFKPGNSSSTSSSLQEIRGTQILDAAADYQNNIKITPEIITALDEFSLDLKKTKNPDAQKLITALNNMFSVRAGTRSNNTAPGALNELSRAVQDDVRAKMEKMIVGADPFLQDDMSYTLPDGSRANVVRPRASRSSPGRPESPQQGSTLRLVSAPFSVSNAARERFVSLAKLMTHFLAVPLANTDKFDDIQLIFYPFNDCAGYANGLNIGQFVIDTNFFFQQYSDFRTQSAGRSANMNLMDFVAFINRVMIDDPGNPVYGIDDLYEKIANRQTGEVSVTPKGNSVEYQTRLENKLRGITPNAEFKMPILCCIVESCPLKTSTDGTTLPDNSKTILKLHFIDKQASKYEGQSALLRAARNTTLNSISNLPNANEAQGDSALRAEHSRVRAEVISLAEQQDLIRSIKTDPSGPDVYVINGGSNAIKDFLKSTMPYILIGANNTGVISANLASMQVPELSTVNLLRNFRQSPLLANGEQPGGLPLSIIPCELPMTTIGCPLFDFTQMFFIDFNTGTTVDNIYGVNGVSHKLDPGSFTTELKFVPFDAYPAYGSFLDRINQGAAQLQALSLARR